MRFAGLNHLLQFFESLLVLLRNLFSSDALLQQEPYECLDIIADGKVQHRSELGIFCVNVLLSATVAIISQQLTGVDSIAILGTVVWESLLEQQPP